MTIGTLFYLLKYKAAAHPDDLITANMKGYEKGRARGFLDGHMAGVSLGLKCGADIRDVVAAVGHS